MDDLDKQIKRRALDNQNYYSGTGWIALPSGATRADAIQTALRTGRVCLLTNDGGFHKQVLCDTTILNQLTFPNNFQGKGSCVVWVNIPVYNKIIIVGLLQAPDGGSIYREYEYQYGRTDLSASSTISGSGAQGRLLLSTSKLGHGSLIELSATNTIPSADVTDVADSTIKFKVNGKILEEIAGYKKSNITQSTLLEIESGQIDTLKTTIRADRESVLISIVNDEENVVNLQYKKDEGLTYKDQYENEIIANETNIQVKGKEAVNLGDGAEPVVLGDTLKKTLEDLITAIKAITVPTAMGPSGTPINFAQFDSINAQLSNILSQYSKTD